MSATSLAGLRKLVRGETAACILTGHLLKDTDALREYHLEGKFDGGPEYGGTAEYRWTGQSCTFPS